MGACVVGWVCGICIYQYSLQLSKQLGKLLLQSLGVNPIYANLILCTWHSIVKSKWWRTEEVWLTTFSCFLTPFHEVTMKRWSALFDASIQEDVDSPLFLFKTACGLWLSGRMKYMLTTSTTLLWTGWRW